MNKKNTPVVDVLASRIRTYGPISNWVPHQVFSTATHILSNTEISDSISSADLAQIRKLTLEAYDTGKRAHLIIASQNSKKVKQYLVDNYSNDIREFDEALSALRIARPGTEVLMIAGSLKSSEDLADIIKAAKGIAYTPDIFNLHQGEFAANLENSVFDYDRKSILFGPVEISTALDRSALRSEQRLNELRDGILTNYLPELKRVYGRRKRDKA